jgi:hypothetical protein
MGLTIAVEEGTVLVRVGRYVQKYQGILTKIFDKQG